MTTSVAGLPSASPLGRLDMNATAPTPRSTTKKTPHDDAVQETGDSSGTSACRTSGSPRGSRSGAGSAIASPPDLPAIQAFMVRSSAKLGCGPVVTAPPPYTFTGCDYALALHACFPSTCIDLASLCWCPTPLPSQLSGNLERFCQAACRLALPETPFSALQPHLLGPTPENSLHHIKVQHWLYVVSCRFPPHPLHDALSMRIFLRHAQLGFPALKRTRTEFESGGIVVGIETATDDDVCASLRAVPPFSAEQLAPCKAFISDVPPFTTSARDGGNEMDQQDGSNTAKAASRGPSPTPENPAHKPKPWLSYSKPWRLPALEAAKAKKEAEAAAAERRRQAREARDPTRAAFTGSSSSLHDQYEVSRKGAQQLRDQLHAIHAAQIASLQSTGDVHFLEALEALKKAGLIPPTPRTTE